MSNLRATVTSKSSSSNIILNNEDKYNEEEYNELEETCEVAEDMDVAVSFITIEKKNRFSRS